jgi:hypothetical protein
MMLNRTLSMRKFSGVPNVTGKEIQPCGINGTGPTPGMDVTARALTLVYAAF